MDLLSTLEATAHYVKKIAFNAITNCGPELNNGRFISTENASTVLIQINIGGGV